MHVRTEQGMRRGQREDLKGLCRSQDFGSYPIGSEGHWKVLSKEAMGFADLHSESSLQH